MAFRLHRIRFLALTDRSAEVLASLLVLGLGFGAAFASAAEPPPARQASEPGRADPAAGRAAYEQSCARCHGVQATGDGVDAKRFYPRPRDLTMGIYKFRTTVSGTPPTDEDLFHTISRGLPGTNMPDWQHLDDATRWQIVHYLKSLSPVFQQTQPEAVPVSADPGRRADLAHGRTVYEKLGCASCHGVQGRADGTSAAGLVDDWGKPVRPADLTLGWTYRGGATPRDIMYRVLSGIDGAGMPSYTGAVTPEDAWHLAYYVASLQQPDRAYRSLHARHITGSLPSTIEDPRWQDAEQADVRLRNAVTADGEWVSAATVNQVGVQALYTDDAVALKLTWHDPVENAAPPATEPGAPHAVRGGEEVPMRDGASADALAVVFKPAGLAGDVVTLQAWPQAGQPPLDLCVWRAAGPAYETVAADPQSAMTGRTPQAPLTAAAAYADGRWQLVLQRPLAPSGPAGATPLVRGMLASIGFFVWDGSNPDARAVSAWLDVDFDALQSHAAH